MLEEKDYRKNSRAVWSAIVGSGTDDLNTMFLSYSLSSIIAEFGISGATGGWLATITNLGMLLGGLVFGYLADRYGSIRVFKWTILTFVFATVGIYFAPNIWTLFILRFISGVGVGGEYGAAMSIISRGSEPKRLGMMSAFNGVAGQVGSIAAALLAAAIIPFFGWRVLFLFGLLPLLIVLYTHFFVTDDLDQEQLAEVKVSSKPAYSDLFTSPKQTWQTIALMFMTTVQIAGYFGLMNWLPNILQKQLNLSVSSSSIWMISTIVGMSIGMLTFGKILDKFGPRLVYGAFLVTSASAVWLFVLANSMVTMIIGGAIAGFFVNGMFAGYGAIVSTLYPQKISAMANNLILNVGRAVGGFSSVIIGWILDQYNTSAVMVFLSSLYLISFCVMLTIDNLKKTNYTKLQEMK